MLKWLKWKELNRKQKWIVGIYGSLVAVFLGYVGIYGCVYAWNVLNVMLDIMDSNFMDSNFCVVYDFEAVNPLIVGKKTSLKIGTSSGSDCLEVRGHKSNTWIWSSQNPEIARVSDDGTVRGIAPGKFSIVAKNESQKLYMSGMVYPPNWKVRIQPEAVTVRVGDRVTFNMVVSDSQGKPLPPVFFFLTTPDYRPPSIGQPDSTPNPNPFLDRSFHGMGAQPGTFRALRPGTITITGKMANQTKQAALTILD